MSKYYQTYYTTGEFAKLCHTTKETLFHYDEIGLLKPAMVNNNGYRYYLSQQYFEFDFIKVLQESHMSLKEIKLFKDQKNSESFISILKEKNQELEKDKKRIEDMQCRIQQTIAMTKYGLNTKHGEPFFIECDEEHLLTIKLPHKPVNDQELVSCISEHLEYCREHHLCEELPLGTIVKKENIYQNIYIEDLYYVVLDRFIDDSRYCYKPQGLYAIILHEGYYDTIDESFEVLLKYIKENDYEVCSDAYEYEIHNYFTVENPEQYLISLSMKIQKM